MKKKIIFVIPTLKSGGAEKSLVTLLQLFDYEKYDVTLFLFRKEGLFLQNIPSEVNIIDAGKDHVIFDGDAKKAVKYFWKKGKINLCIARILYAKSLKNENSYLREKRSWKYFKKSVSYPKEHYDCAIGYLEGMADWLTLELNADKKIGYLHSFPNKMEYNNQNLYEHIDLFDCFVTVTDECLSLVKANTKNKNISVIENIVSPNFIKNRSIGDSLPNGDFIKLLTVGRLVYEKGLEFAVEACKILKDKGYNFKWYHIGVGSLKNDIELLIKNNGLENDFILLGEKSNPYPYLNSCDVYVHPSRTEGKSIAVDEAKCLQKPIVVTNFPSVFDQIENGINGTICEMNGESVAKGIEELILHPEIRQKYADNLSLEKIGNEDEILKLYKLIES